jgi:hypothetical protein
MIIHSLTWFVGRGPLACPSEVGDVVGVLVVVAYRGGMTGDLLALIVRPGVVVGRRLLLVRELVGLGGRSILDLVVQLFASGGKIVNLILRRARLCCVDILFVAARLRLGLLDGFGSRCSLLVH